MTDTPDDFDWYSDPDIVQPETPAVAIYENTAGKVAIRMKADWSEDHDTVIVIDPRYAVAVAEAILKAAGIETASTLTGATTKDRTGAARQRRYRSRHHNGVTEDRNGTAGAPLLTFHDGAAQS
jgi:hypothetical protein